MELEVGILQKQSDHLDKKIGLEQQLLESQISESRARAAYFKAATQAVAAKLPFDVLENYFEE
jgi:hypothetical protein